MRSEMLMDKVEVNDEIDVVDNTKTNEITINDEIDVVDNTKTILKGQSLRRRRRALAKAEAWRYCKIKGIKDKGTRRKVEKLIFRQLEDKSK